MFSLDTPISKISTLKPVQIPKLKKLGIETVRDLLWHFPSRYENFSICVPIAEIAPEETATIKGVITNITQKRTWKRKMTLTEAVIEDDTGSARLIWFNQKYLENTLKKGKRIRVSGKATRDTKGIIFSSPSFELADRAPTHTGGLIPIYPETFGITSKWLRWQIHTLLSKKVSLTDPLPKTLLEKLHLPTLSQALIYIHFPKTKDHAQIARKRFAFEDMLMLQLFSLRVRSSWKGKKALPIRKDEGALQKFQKKLPFTLTSDQEKAVQAITKDLSQSTPMNRLLNGDVGSGKTIVALLSALSVLRAGSQVTFLAPTEVLARQHFENFKTLLSATQKNIPIALFTHSYRLFQSSKNKETTTLTRKEILESIHTGKSRLLIGTHALLSKDVHYKNLHFVIVDEQHRFGVAQRAHLQKNTAVADDGNKETIPHFLTMTATPIPRTLTLAFFGNLDISLLETMPQGRKPIITKYISPLERKSVYKHIQKILHEKQQAYVILPLVEESKALENVKAATKEQEHLQKIFPNFHVGLLHGKMKAKDKESVMEAFSKGAIDILAATAVVEVGVDVPNATAMIIEDADRFGLSQLHQFRGRVGRGKEQSYCFLFSSSSTDHAKKRLSALVKSTDGFYLAKKDLELRGPGQFLGQTQSGFSDIPMESVTNLKLIEIAKKEAKDILQGGKEKYPILHETLEAFEEEVHLE